MRLAAAGIGIAVVAGAAVFALRSRAPAPADQAPAALQPVAMEAPAAGDSSSRLIVYKSPT